MKFILTWPNWTASFLYKSLIFLTRKKLLNFLTTKIEAHNAIAKKPKQNRQKENFLILSISNGMLQQDHKCVQEA